jgi:hypothetical protein
MLETKEDEKVCEKTELQFLKGAVKDENHSNGIFSSPSFPYFSKSKMASKPPCIAKRLIKLMNYPKIKFFF